MLSEINYSNIDCLQNMVLKLDFMGSQWQFCPKEGVVAHSGNAATLTTVGPKHIQTFMPKTTDPSCTSILYHYSMALKSSGCFHLVRSGVFLESGLFPYFLCTVVLPWYEKRGEIDVSLTCFFWHNLCLDCRYLYKFPPYWIFCRVTQLYYCSSFAVARAHFVFVKSALTYQSQ